MTGIGELCREVAEAVAVGAVVSPFRACLDVLRANAGDPHRGAIYSLLDTIASVQDQEWTRVAVENCVAVLEAFSEGDSVLQGERKAVLAKLNSKSPKPVSSPGYVNVLLDARRRVGKYKVGVVRRFMVASEPWGGSVGVSGRVDPELERAFSLGVRVARECLYRRGLEGLDGAILLRSRSYDGQFPGLADSVAGPSIGLAAGIAVLSSLFSHPVDETTAFTGIVEPDGRLQQPVTGLEPKLAAAADMGIHTVWCPEQGQPSVQGLSVRRASSVDDVVKEIFPNDVISAGVRRLRDEALRNSDRRRVWLATDNDSEAASRVLVSAVGGTDPFSAKNNEDGNVLAIASAYKLDRAYLFHTTDEEFSKRAAQVTQELKKRHASMKVIPRPLETVDDPTDFGQLFTVLRDDAYRLLDELSSVGADPSKTAIYVNVSSGTPQMQLTMHLLVEREILPDRRLQVRESEKAQGGPRVLRVILPVL